jgi:hypothetical protein
VGQVQSPYEAVVATSTDRVLYALGLRVLPAPPVDLAAVLAAAQGFPPSPVNYTGEHNEIIPGALAHLSGSCQLDYPAGAGGSVQLVALAVVAGAMPYLLVGWQELPKPATLAAPGDGCLTSFALSVARQPQ